MELSHNFLFTLPEEGPSQRHVFQEGSVLVIESPYTADSYKRTHAAFVSSFRNQGMFFRIRDIFFRYQSSLYRMHKNIVQRIISYLTTPVPTIFSYGKFLDVGCNTGAFLSKLPDPWQRYGVELNEEACRQANQYKNIEVYNRPLEQFKTDFRFSFVRLSHVIEHISEPHQFLNVLHELTLDRGYALFYTPNTRSISYFLFRKYWGGLYEKTHVRLYNPSNLQNLCEAHGFKMVKKGTYYMGMSAGSILRVLRINDTSPFGRFLYWGLFIAFYPFSFLVNALKLGGALYLYVEKRTNN